MKRFDEPISSDVHTATQGARLIERPARLQLLDALPRKSVGAEIGVHVGDFSNQILAIIQPQQLFLIDPWLHMSADEYRKAWYGGLALGGQSEMDSRYTAALQRFRLQIAAGQVVVMRQFSVEACHSFKDESLDWVYIDGNHLYDFARADLEFYFEKVKPGGYLAGDDYVNGGWWFGGVKRAVDEFSASRSLDSIAIIGDQFLLRKR